MFFANLMSSMLGRRQPRFTKRRLTANVAAPTSAMVETLEDRALLAAAPSITGVDITSITAVSDTDGNDNLPADTTHVTVLAGATVQVNFDYTITVDGGVANTNQHAEIWATDFSGAALATGVSNVVVNDSVGAHSGSVGVSTTGLAPGDYGIKVLITHKGNATDTDSSGVTILTATVTVTGTTTTVTAPNATYDGSPHGATASTTPGAAAGSTTFLYTGTGATSYSSATAPTDAGTYHVVATFTPSSNLYSGSTGSADFTIAKAPSVTTTAGAGPFTYDGTTHTGGSGTVTGAGGLSTGATSLTYTGDQVNAGTYYVTAHYAGDANHLASDGAAVPITINKASLTVNIANDCKTYGETPKDLAADLGTTIATGINGENLSIAYSSAGNLTFASAGTYALNGAVTDGSGLLSNYNVTVNPGTFTVKQAILTGTAVTQAALNVAKNGTLAWTIAIDAASIVDNQSVYNLLNGAVFTLKINGVAYNITSTASVGLDGTVYVNWTVDAGLKDALDNWTTAANSSASTAAAGNLTVSATTNGGNYAFSDDFLTKLFYSKK